MSNKNQIISKLKEKLIRNSIIHGSKIEVASEIAKSLSEFSKTKSPFTLIAGATNTIKALFDIHYPENMFNQTNGWIELEFNFDLASIFASVLDKFDAQYLNFKFSKDRSHKIIHLPIGDIGYASPNRWEPAQIYFQPGIISKQKLLDFLVKEKFQQIKSKIVSLNHVIYSDDKPKSVVLIEEEGLTFQPNLFNLTTKLQCYFDQNLNRSWLFTGVPGTGKTTTAQGLVEYFNFRTLKVRFDQNFDFNLFKFLLDKFKFEAVIIDDFDQVKNSNELLEFLQYLNQNIKLTIIIVNSLKDFHSALLRPGRIDQIITIDKLDVDVVKNLLGSSLSSYFTKVQDWPIAFINELIARAKVVSRKQLMSEYKELQIRVDKQRKDLGESSDEE